MDIENLSELAEVIALMRAEGVLYLKLGDNEITLGPQLARGRAAEPDTDQDKPELVQVESKPTRRNLMLDHPSLKLAR